MANDDDSCDIFFELKPALANNRADKLVACLGILSTLQIVPQITMAAKTDYSHSGLYNRTIFQKEFAAHFSKNGRYNVAAIPDMMQLLGMIERDPGINDVRQVAYILATVFWETTYPTSISRPAIGKNGKQIMGKDGSPVHIKERKWLMTMAPVDEVGRGRGRKYYDPVKVKSLTDGSVRITERDGDQFKVSPAGRITSVTKNATMGNPPGELIHKNYNTDDGVEQVYFGRGYTQLTWWSNYAKAGVTLGRGLDLLMNPELAKDPEIAYKLMSIGMLTGAGFANGKRFSQYFNSQSSNYVGARAMVNGEDHANDIAEVARQFEKVLMSSKISKKKEVPA